MAESCSECQRTGNEDLGGSPPKFFLDRADIIIYSIIGVVDLGKIKRIHVKGKLARLRMLKMYDRRVIGQVITPRMYDLMHKNGYASISDFTNALIDRINELETKQAKASPSKKAVTSVAQDGIG